MIFAYQNLEDAWARGLERWCRAAAGVALGGGEAWLVTACPGQAAWVKRRLLRAGVPLFGLRVFGEPADLRRALCRRRGLEPPAFGRETLELLLRVNAARVPSKEARDEAAARQPAGALAMLEDLAAVGWLASDAPDAEEIGGLLSEPLQRGLGALRGAGAWTAELDGRLRREAERGSAPTGAPPLAVCALGWDAGCWPRLDLLLAAMRAGGASTGALAFLPLPRAGETEGLGQGWLETVAAGLGAAEWAVCPAAREALATRFPWAELAERLQSGDLGPAGSGDEALAARPDTLVGSEGRDQVELARRWIQEWLLATAGDPDARLAVAAPGRNPTTLALGRALGEAGIVFEDALGERPEPALPWQIARAVVDYHLDETGIGPLLTLVGLLNDHPECVKGGDFGLPLDPLELRRALASAFTELQHTNAQLLTSGGAFGRSRLAGPVRRMVAHLDRWPATLTWADARARWERGLRGFGLDPAAMLEPLWSGGAGVLAADEPVPGRAWWEYLRGLLAAGGGAARALPEGGKKFARVVLTTLSEAAGQTWHSALFLDSNEGVWPRPPAENPFLDDARRSRLNARRAELREAGQPAPGHLLTSGDRVRLEAGRFYELLENLAPDGRLAFASTRHDPADPAREAHPNEWSLRCWIEAASAAERAADHWLERWRDSAQRCAPVPPERLPRAEAAHLGAVWARRRDPAAAFDEYQFDFHELGAAPAAGELAFEPAWAARRLDAALRSPATFALEQIFGVEPWREGGGAAPGRAEAWAVGRLAHRWVRAALGGEAGAQPLDAARVRRALTQGLTRVRREEEKALRRSLFSSSAAAAEGAGALPPWWRSVLAKTGWAARRCLESLAERVAADPGAAAWFCMGRELSAEVPTPAGPLRLSGRADLLLLDRAELAGAACQVVDLKTGGHGAAPTLARASDGQGLDLAAGLFLALAHGAEPSRTSVGVLHPEAASWEALSAESLAPLASEGALLALARRQRGLSFGQDAADERMPLAASPIHAAVLAAKAERGR